MTNEEKRYVANDIIANINAPTVRMIARIKGKGATVKQCVDFYLQDEDELLEGDKAEIEEMVWTAAKDSLYPNAKVPVITCRLSFEEFLELSDVTKGEMQKMMDTLACLLDVMHDNDDERAQVICAAFSELSKLTDYGDKLK